MATATEDMDAEHAASLGRRYLIRFEEDTLRPRPLWIRLIIEFLGTFILVTVAAGAGVINHQPASHVMHARWRRSWPRGVNTGGRWRWRSWWPRFCMWRCPPSTG